MRIRYLYDCPRGLANEIAIYRIATLEQLREAQRMIENADNDPYRTCRFIRATEAEARCRANRQQAKSQLRAGLNLSQNPVGVREIENFEVGESQEEIDARWRADLDYEKREGRKLLAQMRADADAEK
jgi:hypothetical protein